MRLLTLCSGAGLFDTVVEQRLKLDLHIGVDTDPNRVHCANLNHNSTYYLHDVRDLFSFASTFDWVHASPPCNEASAVNPKGKETEFSTSIADGINRHLEYYRPEFFTLENVPQYESFESFKRIIQKLNSLNYHVTFGVFDSAQLKAAVRRKRLLLFASKKEIRIPPSSSTRTQDTWKDTEWGKRQQWLKYTAFGKEVRIPSGYPIPSLFYGAAATLRSDEDEPVPPQFLLDCWLGGYSKKWDFGTGGKSSSMNQIVLGMVWSHSLLLCDYVQTNL